MESSQSQGSTEVHKRTRKPIGPEEVQNILADFDGVNGKKKGVVEIARERRHNPAVVSKILKDNAREIPRGRAAAKRLAVAA